MIGIIATGMIVVVAFIPMITTMLTTTVIARKELNVILLISILAAMIMLSMAVTLEKLLFCSGKSVNTNAYISSNHKRYS